MVRGDAHPPRIDQEPASNWDDAQNDFASLSAAVFSCRVLLTSTIFAADNGFVGALASANSLTKRVPVLGLFLDRASKTRESSAGYSINPVRRILFRVMDGPKSVCAFSPMHPNLQILAGALSCQEETFGAEQIPVEEVTRRERMRPAHPDCRSSARANIRPDRGVGRSFYRPDRGVGRSF